MRQQLVYQWGRWETSSRNALAVQLNQHRGEKCYIPGQGPRYALGK